MAGPDVDVEPAMAGGKEAVQEDVLGVLGVRDHAAASVDSPLISTLYVGGVAAARSPISQHGSPASPQQFPRTRRPSPPLLLTQVFPAERRPQPASSAAIAATADRP